MAMLLVAGLVAGCGKAGGPETAREEGSLRSRTDTVRGRLWVLGLDDVRVYDVASGRLIRQITLPNWSVARFVCQPDLALDRSGAATVSSNVQARLWRIDAGSFEVKEREIVLQGRERWDTGFGALAFSANGTLFGVTVSAGSLWRIDPDKGSASLLDATTAYANTCELASRLVNDFERRYKP